MHQPPTIRLIESKQIIPNKNVFGESNFGVNASNVVIQLSSVPDRIRKRFNPGVVRAAQAKIDPPPARPVTKQNDDTDHSDSSADTRAEGERKSTI